MRAVPEEVIVAALRAAARGQAPPTVARYEEMRTRRATPRTAPWPSSKTILRRYGSWAGAVRAAGFRVPARRLQVPRYTRRELAEIVSDAGALLPGQRLTERAFDRLARGRTLPDGRPWPRARSIRRWLSAKGSLETTTRRAPPRRDALRPLIPTGAVPYAGHATRHSDGAILEALRRAAREMGVGSLSIRRYRAHAAGHAAPPGGWPAVSTVARRFGDWGAAVSRADLVCEGRPYRIEPEDCGAGLWAARCVLGRWPTGMEYTALRRAGAIEAPSIETVLARMGTWQQALVAAGHAAPATSPARDQASARAAYP